MTRRDECDRGKCRMSRRDPESPLKLKNFLWWLAVLSDSQISLVDDTVKFKLRKPNNDADPIR